MLSGVCLNPSTFVTLPLENLLDSTNIDCAIDRSLQCGTLPRGLYCLLVSFPFFANNSFFFFLLETLEVVFKYGRQSSYTQQALAERG